MNTLALGFSLYCFFFTNTAKQAGNKETNSAKKIKEKKNNRML